MHHQGGSLQLGDLSSEERSRSYVHNVVEFSEIERSMMPSPLLSLDIGSGSLTHEIEMSSLYSEICVKETT